MPEIVMSTVPNNYDLFRDDWKWVVKVFKRNGELLIETVHKGEFTRDMEVGAAAMLPNVGLIKILTWHEAGKPYPKNRRHK